MPRRAAPADDGAPGRDARAPVVRGPGAGRGGPGPRGRGHRPGCLASRPMEEGTPQLRPIGVVESTLADPASAPKQGREGAPEACLALDPAVVDGLDGLRPGDEVVVLTWLDR